MSDSDKLYVYTVCNITEKMSSRSCYGLFKTAEDACRAIERNDGDMFEYFFTYAVVEKYEVGAYPKPKEIQWYKLIEYKDRKAIIEKCDRPVTEGFKSIRNFALG